MRIAATYIPASTNRLPSSPAVSPVTRQQELAGAAACARHSGRQNSQVIDAEYVEFYSPAVADFHQERSSLDARIDTGAPMTTSDFPPPNRLPDSAYLRQQVAASKPSGTHIDLYA